MGELCVCSEAARAGFADELPAQRERREPGLSRFGLSSGKDGAAVPWGGRLRGTS